jgi:protein-disulfide isomerase
MSRAFPVRIRELPVIASLSQIFVVRAAAAAFALALVFGGAAEAQTPPKPDGTVDMATVLKPGPLPEISLGNPNGVTVVEYGSLTCPHCAAFDHEVMPQIKTNYIDTGKVHYIFREFSRNPLDEAAFIIARCVGEDKVFPTIELLFAEQEKWAFVDNPLEALLTAVRPTGLTKDKAMACLQDQSKADAMAQIVKTAVDTVKVTGTPTFVIDGKVYGGEMSYKDFEAVLKPLIK